MALAQFPYDGYFKIAPPDWAHDCRRRGHVGSTDARPCRDCHRAHHVAYQLVHRHFDVAAPDPDPVLAERWAAFCEQMPARIAAIREEEGFDGRRTQPPALFGPHLYQTA